MKRIAFFCLAFFLLHAHTALGQSLKQQKMAQLSYMVGEWVGTSSLFKDGKRTSQAPAFEEIAYDLNQSILVIQLNSETLKLHTVIYFDEKDDTYYYTPFSENGSRKLPAEFKDGKFIVNASENKRFIFEKVGKNGFREYGEERVEGKWVMYFEDVFTNTQ